MATRLFCNKNNIAVVDPGMHTSFLFAMCRPMWPYYAAAALGRLLI